MMKNDWSLRCQIWSVADRSRRTHSRSCSLHDDSSVRCTSSSSTSPSCALSRRRRNNGLWLRSSSGFSLTMALGRGGGGGSGKYGSDCCWCCWCCWWWWRWYDVIVTSYARTQNSNVSNSHVRNILLLISYHRKSAIRYMYPLTTFSDNNIYSIAIVLVKFSVCVTYPNVYSEISFHWHSITTVRLHSKLKVKLLMTSWHYTILL